MSRLKGLLIKKEFPYLFVILIAMAGWTVKEINSKIDKETILKLTTDYHELAYPYSAPDSLTNTLVGHFAYSITNLSRDKVVKDLNLMCEIPVKSDGFLIFRDRLATEGYFRYNQRDPKFIEDKSKTDLFTLYRLFPGQTAVVSYYYRAENKPSVFLDINNQSPVDTPLNLVDEGLVTFVVEYNVELLVTLLTVFLLGLFIYGRIIISEHETK